MAEPSNSTPYTSAEEEPNNHPPLPLAEEEPNNDPPCPSATRLFNALINDPPDPVAFACGNCRAHKAFHFNFCQEFINDFYFDELLFYQFEGVVPENYTLHRQTVGEGPLAPTLEMVRVNCSNCKNFLGFQIVRVLTNDEQVFCPGRFVILGSNLHIVVMKFSTEP